MRTPRDFSIAEARIQRFFAGALDDASTQEQVAEIERERERALESLVDHFIDD